MRWEKIEAFQFPPLLFYGTLVFGLATWYLSLIMFETFCGFLVLISSKNNLNKCPVGNCCIRYVMLAPSLQDLFTNGCRCVCKGVVFLL